MDVYETIKNIRRKCDNYVDPNLVATIIDENNFMGKNNISELDGYGFSDDDSYEDKFMKVLKKENLFVTFGMLNFIPIINECDIFSFSDETIEITQKEFDANCQEQEVFFGILIEKNAYNYQIGTIDLCNCKVGSSFRAIKKSDDGLYKKLTEIIEKEIIS
jgi:hypothetical protein